MEYVYVEYKVLIYLTTYTLKSAFDLSNPPFYVCPVIRKVIVMGTVKQSLTPTSNKFSTLPLKNVSILD